MKVRFIFAWYDLWVGVFVDRPKRRVYIFPIPCFGVVITRARAQETPDVDTSVNLPESRQGGNPNAQG